MTGKEIENVSIGMSFLMADILNTDSTPEEVANTAISFAKEMFRQYPKIKEVTGDIISQFDKHDPDFNNAWDRNIEWIRNWSS